MRQLHSIVCWFLCVYLNLTEFAWSEHKIVLNIKTELFWCSGSDQVNSGKKRGNTQKSTNNHISSFGLIEKNMALSHIYLAVPRQIPLMQYFEFKRCLSPYCASVYNKGRENLTHLNLHQQAVCVKLNNHGQVVVWPCFWLTGTSCYMAAFLLLNQCIVVVLHCSMFV